MAGAVWFVACGRNASEMTPDQRLAYEVKPAIVRVNAYATAKFSYPADEIRSIALLSSGSAS